MAYRAMMALGDGGQEETPESRADLADGTEPGWVG